jgi:hypothetical protein
LWGGWGDVGAIAELAAAGIGWNSAWLGIVAGGGRRAGDDKTGQQDDRRPAAFL